LVGGAGTRLGSLTAVTPKPLLPVGDRPFLEYLLDEIARYGVFEHIVLLAGHLGQEVAGRYDGRRWGAATITVLVEPAPLGTGGALVHAHARQMLDQYFLLMNGDSFLDCNLLDLAAGSLPPGVLGRMALLADHDEDRYGRVELDADRVAAFRAPGKQVRGPINAGIYALSRDLVGLLEPTPSSLERDALPRLARDGALQAKVYDGFFIDIGIPSDYARADRELGARLTRPAVFFDRDGVINQDLGYIHRSDQVIWIDGAKQAIKRCNDLGHFVFVVSNQAGVARGYYAEADIAKLHAWMNRELAAAGAHIDAFEYCPHHEEASIERYRRACRRRKPEAGMITDLLDSRPVNRARSFLIGDKDSDIEAATKAGIAGFRFPGGDLLAFLAARLGERTNVGSPSTHSSSHAREFNQSSEG
jgi:D-glycero-D-manno-heptose 1,7-bisphosphate phosphatase